MQGGEARHPVSTWQVQWLCIFIGNQRPLNGNLHQSYNTESTGWQNSQDLHRVPVAGRVAFKMQVLELICQQTGLQGAVYILFENSQQLKKNAGIKVELNLVKLYFHVDRALIRCYSLLFNFLFQLKQNMFTCCNNRRCEN